METVIEYGNDTLAIIEKSKSFKIFDARSFNESSELTIEIAKAIKQTKANWAGLVEKAKASYDETKMSRDSELRPLEEAAKYIGSVRAAWKDEQDRITREENLRLQRLEIARVEKEQQVLLEKAVNAKTPEKAEALLEKAELVYEKPVCVVPVVQKTTKIESGGSITWIKDIEVTVNSTRLLCNAIGEGTAPITIVEFKNLKAWVKANGITDFQGLTITEIQRESKRF